MNLVFKGHGFLLAVFCLNVFFELHNTALCDAIKFIASYYKPRFFITPYCTLIRTSRINQYLFGFEFREQLIDEGFDYLGAITFV
ncbi:MAG: hypothetical protein ABIH77_05015 [Pseudomonadota bacterium]